MDHFVGLDVSAKEMSVYIMDDTGRIVREVKVASKPNALLAVPTNPAYHFTDRRPLVNPWLRRFNSKKADVSIALGRAAQVPAH